VLAPSLLVIFFFGSYFLSSTGKELLIYNFIAEHEYAALFCASWWQQCERANFGYIVPEETIEWLRERLPKRMPIDIDTFNNSFQTNVEWLLERMEEFIRAPTYIRHVLPFPGTSVPPSECVDT